MFRRGHGEPGRLLFRRGARASALVIPVPDAEPYVADYRARHDPNVRCGLPAHITVLYPFLPAGRLEPDVVDALDTTLATCSPFEFAFSRVGHFDGVHYLAPTPTAPFVALTTSVCERWPDHPPYRGVHADIVPHMTVAQGECPPSFETDFAPVLPIGSRANEVWLLTQPSGARWTLHSRFRLGHGGDAS
ncbi:MAG TPA: 2'-5' RNA ligase family protein [Acidimicrobiia bacterium]|jgi:2'-5' RNA ligase